MKKLLALLGVSGVLVGGLVGLPPASSQTPPTAVISKRVIGTSVQGRPIVAYRLGEPDSPKDPTVVLISTMHGDEPATRQILQALRDGGPIIGIDLWVVPTHNPDGLAAGTRKNAHGVDLNRNYPYRWADLDGSYESGPEAGLGAGDQGDDALPALGPARPGPELPPAAQRGRHRHQGRGVRAPRGRPAEPAAQELRLRWGLPRHHDRLVQPRLPRVRCSPSSTATAPASG